MSQKFKKYIGLAAAFGISLAIFGFRGQFARLEKYGYLGLFLLSVFGNATVILPVPVVLTAFLAGGLLQPFAVAVFTALGASIGELTGYLAGISGRIVVDKNPQLEKVQDKMQKHGLWVLFVLAAIPNPLFDLAGIVAGVSKIPVWKYLTAVFLGKCVKFLIFSYLGAGAVGVIEN